MIVVLARKSSRPIAIVVVAVLCCGVAIKTFPVFNFIKMAKLVVAVISCSGYSCADIPIYSGERNSLESHPFPLGNGAYNYLQESVLQNPRPWNELVQKYSSIRNFEADENVVGSDVRPFLLLHEFVGANNEKGLLCIRYATRGCSTLRAFFINYSKAQLQPSIKPCEIFLDNQGIKDLSSMYIFQNLMNRAKWKSVTIYGALIAKAKNSFTFRVTMDGVGTQFTGILETRESEMRVRIVPGGVRTN